jgi:hypothetical protein
MSFQKSIRKVGGEYREETDIVKVDNILFSKSDEGSGTREIPKTSQCGRASYYPLPSNNLDFSITIYHSRITTDSIIMAVASQNGFFGGHINSVKNVYVYPPMDGSGSFKVTLASNEFTNVDWFIVKF